MTFSLVDFVVGFLLLGAMVHIVMFSISHDFPSVFGRHPSANLYHGLLVGIGVVLVYGFVNGVDATINNSLLMGALDMMILYALLGRILHRRLYTQRVGV